MLLGTVENNFLPLGLPINILSCEVSSQITGRVLDNFAHEMLLEREYHIIAIVFPFIHVFL